jgi:gliding motility-associated-like protein
MLFSACDIFKSRLNLVVFLCSFISVVASIEAQSQCVATTANGFQENLLQATFHSALYKTSDGYAASGASTAPDGTSQPNIQVLSNANGYTGIPTSTTIVWGTIGGNAQIVLLGDDGVLYAGGDEGIVLDPLLTSGNAFGPISLGLPVGIGISDIQKFQASNEVLMIHTLSGEIYVTGNECGNLTTPCVSISWNQVAMPVGVTAEIADLSAKTLFIYGSDGNFYTRGKRIFEGNGDPSTDVTATWLIMIPPSLSAGSAPVQIELANHEHYNQIGYLILDANGTIHSLGDAPIVANNSAASFTWTKVGLNCPDGELNNVIYLSANDNDNRHVGAAAILADSTIMLWGVNDFNMLAGASYQCPEVVCSEVGSDMSSILYVENGTHITPAITSSGQLCNVGHNSEGGFGDGTMNNRSCFECYDVPSLPDLCINGSCNQDTTVIATICEGTTYIEQSSTYSASGTYTDIYQTLNGCDSVVTTELTVLPIAATTNEVTICPGQSYFEQSSEYSVAGTYTDIYPLANGCDSTVTTILSVLSQIDISNDITICAGETYFEGTSEYSASGTFQDIYVSAGGCDSIVTTTLIVLPALESTNEVSICTGQSYFEGSSEYSVAGTYQDNYVTGLGCDSVVTTILSVLPVIESTNEVAICIGESYFEGSSEYTVTGTYQDNYVTATGCDSTVITVLEVISELSTPIEAVICEGEVYYEQDSEYTIAGTYTDTYASAIGCDSVVITVLTVLSNQTVAQSVSICEGEVFQGQGSIYTESGIYADVYQSVDGCDSIVLTSLTVLPLPLVDIGQDTVVSCEPIELSFSNHAGNSNGVVYSWDFGDGTSSSENPVTHLFEDIGQYNISLTVTDGLCQNSNENPYLVEIAETPSAQFSASPWQAEISEPEIQFFDESIGNSILQEWDFGDGFFDAGNTVTHSYTEVGDYTVTLFIVNEAGCSSEISQGVSIVDNEITFLIPNAFIPDSNSGGDGSFDVESDDITVFFPYSEHALTRELFVFNRWGEQIYYSTDLEKGWNGFFQGNPCPQDVYSYRVIFTYAEGGIVERLGTVTLFR